MSAVLLVDDEPGMLETLGEILDSAGYKVTAVADGDAALDALLTREFDVVVMDVRSAAAMNETSNPTASRMPASLARAACSRERTANSSR